MDETAPRGETLDRPLIGPGDPPAVTLVNAASAVPVVLHCDHGGAAVPLRLNRLGLPADVFGTHIAQDIGAAEVTQVAAMQLGAPAIIANYSRLVIDPNRPPGDPDAIPTVSDGVTISGNASLADLEIDARLNDIYWPYHHAIDRAIAKSRAGGQVPFIVSVHSFTPALMSGGGARPWHVGVMYDRDQRLGRALIAAFEARDRFVVGRNQPYSGITHGYGLKVHGFAQGMAHAQIEIRQDLICTAAGQLWWGRLFADILASILGQSELHAIRHG